jgi:dihydropteroate synthase
MVLAGADLLYRAGTVEMEIDAVQLGLMFPHCAEEAGLDIIRMSPFG